MNNYITDGPILSKVFENSKFKDNQRNSNLENAKKIYDKVPNSQTRFSNNVGLVVGKIQSGKTANIITLSGLALDNDTKMIVMFLSDTTNLLDQNYKRISKSFDDCKDTIVFRVAKDSNDFSELDKDSLDRLYKRNKKIIICCLKHFKYINSINKVVSNSSYSNDYSLIIDDEGDDISQNTSKDKIAYNSEGKTVENLRTTNNEAIVSLKKTFSKCGYISLTATPEAPLFLQNFQELSPNYCVTLSPGVGYTGLTTFHQYDSKYIEIVDDYDCLIKDSGIPLSLIDAVAFFFAGCIYRVNKKYNDDLHSMMIHPAKEIYKHMNVYSKLKLRIDLLKKCLIRDEISGLDFLELVNEKYFLIAGIKGIIKKEDLLYVFDNYNISYINGDNPDKDINNKTRIFPYNIFIGGDLLDRGITIPNLAVSYIIRDSKVGQVDTLLQRARWFGYKKDYLMTCRVYLTKSLADKYNSILDTEDSLWEFLDECSAMDYDLHNHDISLEINSSILRPTSTSKVFLEYEYSNISRVKSQKTFTINKDLNDYNKSLVNSFDWDNSIILQYNSYQKHRYLNLNVNTINTFIDNFNFSETIFSNDWLNKDLLKKYVNDNIEKYGNNVCLIDMRYEVKEERSLYNENGKIIVRNLLQGFSEGKDKLDPDYYYGDRNLPEMRNKISIQIHHVILKNYKGDYYNNGDEIIMLVLCMPNDFVVKNYVRKKNIADADRVYVYTN